MFISNSRVTTSPVMANSSNAFSPLPPEIIQSIQRILSLPSEPEDPLDDISARFDPITSLNNLFPDGAFNHWSVCDLA